MSNAVTAQRVDLDGTIEGLGRSINDICTLVDRLREQRAELTAQRDELLVALKAVVSIYDGVRDAIAPHGSVALKLAQADAVIQKAEQS